MPRRPSFASLRTDRERAAYGKAMALDAEVRARGGTAPIGELRTTYGQDPRTTAKYLGTAARREGGFWVARDPGRMSKLMNVVTAPNGAVITARFKDSGDRSLIARHFHAIRQLTEFGDPRDLRRLRRVTVRDEQGRRYRLLTNERKLRELGTAGRFKGLEPY